MPLSLALALAVPTILEQRVILPAGAATIARPKLDGPRHLRLVAPKATRLFLNQEPLSPNENGDFDVTDRLPASLTATPPTQVELVITPRIYIARQDFRLQGGELAVRIWVRNTLENTANLYFTITAPGLHLESSATVPPGVTQSVEIRGPFTPPYSYKTNLTTVLEKQEEAMEGGYKYQVVESIALTPP